MAHNFATTNIGGNATVQLGDRHVVTTLNVAAAYIDLRDERNLQNFITRCDTKRSCVGSRRSKKRRISAVTRECRSHGNDLVEENLVPLPQPLASGSKTRRSPGDQTELTLHTKERHKKNEFQRKSSIGADHLSQDEEQEGPILETSAAMQKIARCLTNILQSARASETPSRQLPAILSARQNDQQAIAAVLKSGGTLQELYRLCVFLILCLIYRNVNISVQDIAKVLNKCQQDRLTPLLTAVIGFGIARYIYFGSVAQSLSDLTGDCFILEDAFCMERRVPLAEVCRFSKLKAFLEFHYEGTTGHAFVTAGRFNLTLGSRHGKTFRCDEWNVASQIQPDSKVVMSVYITVPARICIYCQGDLSSGRLAEFYWYVCNYLTFHNPNHHSASCDRYFRDRSVSATFQESSSTVSFQPVRTDAQTSPSDDKSTASAAASLKESPEIDSGSANLQLDEHHLGTLKNVDLRITDPVSEHTMLPSTSPTTAATTSSQYPDPAPSIAYESPLTPPETSSHVPASPHPVSPKLIPTAGMF